MIDYGGYVMKKSILIKLLMLFMCGAMMLSFSACEAEIGGVKASAQKGAEAPIDQPTASAANTAQNNAPSVTSAPIVDAANTAQNAAAPVANAANATATAETSKAAQDTDWDPTAEHIAYATKYPYVDRDGVVHITFQDTYTFESRAVSVNNVQITSYKTGKDVKDDTVLTLKSGAVYASGCGIATVTLEDGSERCVAVHPSPINLLFLTGQSNGAGDPPSADTYEKGEYQKYFKSSPETMAYYTWTGQGLSIYSASDYVTKSLVWNNMGVKNGCEPSVLTKTNYTGGFANFSVCAGLAYEWIEQTGERVWIVNASHGGQPIHCFKPSENGEVVDNDYYQAVTVFNLALDTLYREVDAGHFTLNHMAYYWFQGEGDSTNTYEYYYEAFAEMHEAMQRDVVYDHNGVEKKLEYCGIFTIRSSGNSVTELQLTGPRLAQYTAANMLEGAYENVFLATKATESWIISDENVKNYFLDVYGSNENFKAIYGYDIPDTLKEVHPQIHYRIFGQNEMGADAARNTLKFLNYLYPERAYKLSYEIETDKPELKLVSLDGYTELTDTLYFDSARMITHLVPYITPVWRTVEGLSLKVLTQGFEVEGFRIISKNQDVKELTVQILLGGKVLETKNFKVKYSSSFIENQPLIVNYGTSLYPDRRFDGYQPGWDAGFLNYSTGKFDVYTAVHKDGWIYDGKAIWEKTNGGGHGGILVSGGVKLGPTAHYESEGTLGIRYTAGKSGKVKISASTFTPNLDSCYVAVFVNGEKVWPVNDAPANKLAGWKLYSTSANTETLNKDWADLILDIKEGDEVVFAVARYNTNSQTIFYPTVEYID